MSNLAIVHNNKWNTLTPKRGTFVIELPKKEDLENLFKLHGSCTLVKIGFVRLHPKEQYNKKVGVKLATEKMAYVGAYLNSVEIRGTQHVYHFEANIPNRSPEEELQQPIHFGVSTINETDRVCLIYAEHAKDL